MINVMNRRLDAQLALNSLRHAVVCVVWRVGEPEMNTDLFIVAMTAGSLTGTGTTSLSCEILRSSIMFSIHITYRS